MKPIVTVIVCGLAMLLAIPAPCETGEAAADQTLLDAIAAYDRAQAAGDRDTRNREFRNAAAGFESVARSSGGNAELWTNAGNAELQAHTLGRAIVAYRRALLIDPDNARARQNLAHARSLLPPFVPRPEETGVLESFFFWHKSLSAAERSTLAAAAFALTGLILGWAMAVKRPALRTLAIPPLLVWLAMAGSLAVDMRQARTVDAVIVVDDTIARASDSIHAAPRFASPLPAGTEISVVEERARFSKIRLSNGREGWVAASSYETLTR